MSTSEIVEDRSVKEPSLNTESVVEAPKSTLDVQTQPSLVECGKSTWLVGDIVWSKIPGHPWWPSMIAYEPNTAVYFKYKGRTKYFHVQFFGTEALRGWVTERNILQYEGKPHFLSLRLSVHGKQHKIGNKQLPLWETATKMADKALPLNRHERQLCFTFKYDETGKPNISIEPTPDHVTGVLEVNQSKTSFTPESGKKRSKNGIEKVCNGSDDIFEPPIKKTKDDKNVVKVLGLKETDTLCNSSPTNKAKSTKHRKSETPKQAKNTLGKQTKNKLDKQVKNKLGKQVKNKLDKQIKDKETKTFKPIVVKHSPTACTVQINLNPKTPEQGKRKRGRPRKDLLFLVDNSEGGNEKAGTLAKKPRTEKQSVVMKVLENNLQSLPCESEKSDVASDTNSTSSMDIESRSNKSMLKTKDYVCTVCEQPDNLLICEGACNRAYHKDCLGLSCDVLPEKFICDECTSGNHTCFICRKTNSVVKCSSQNCGKFYHLDCIKTVDPKIINENFICPLHHCDVCGTSKSSSVKRRLACCTRCPVAYHSGTCIVAGSLPITTQYLVCKRHFMADKKKAHHSHVNVNWCFVCSIGGTLICCETCPAAFHPECIQETGIPEGSFFCRDCKDGKELLYGEIVWVKLGMYRWWPAQICNPNNIPTNIHKMQHQPGEFPVQFLGSHDYYWIHRGRVFSYQEGDKGSIKSGGKYLAEIFKKALDEAKDKYAEWQKAQEEKAEKDLEKLSKKPAVYKHIKVNRYTTATRYVIDESDMSTCDCVMNEENPCGADSHCLNRILYVECSPLKCRAKEKCQNQCFVKRQDLDCEPFRAERRGWGLRAKADAKKGQFVIEYVGELINEETCRERVRKGINDGVINYYMLTIDKDCIIDAGPMGNLSRFMNHSCDPNCETQKWRVNGEVRVGLFAKRDIKAGEELVFDYQLDCLGNEKKKCSCGSENCSGFLGVRPKTQHALKLQEEKKKNQDSKKKKKKNANKKNPAVVDEHEDECFDCGDGGELIMCSKTGCSKCYHLSCLTLDKIPYGNWQCPWHFCDDCGKAAMLRCDECSNSFCLAHAPGQIVKAMNGRYLCDQHPGLNATDLVNPDIIPEYSANTSSETTNISSDPTNTPSHPTKTSNNHTNTSDPTNASSDPTNTTSDPTNTTSYPTNASSDPINTTSHPTNNPSDPTSTTSHPTSTTSDPNNTSSHPTNNSSDPTSTTSDPTSTTRDPPTCIDPPSISSDPINTSSVSTSTCSDPTNTPSDPTSSSNDSSGPNKTPKDPDGIPQNTLNIHTQPGYVRLNPLDEHSDPSSIPTSPSSVLMDPTNAPINPTVKPISPTNVPGDYINVPKDPASNHEDLLRNPISVPKIHVVS